MANYSTLLSLRTGYLLAAFACAGLLAAAYYFEYVLFLDPCPLCMVQRLATLLTGLGFFMAFLVQPKGTRWLTFALLFTLAAALFGWWAAAHHIGIQNLPASDIPACGPSFEYLMQTLPLSELLRIMLAGDGNCAEISWQFMGLSMPEWVQLWFIAFSVFIIAALVRIWRQRSIR